jgi:hypothetical protein
MQLFMDSRGKWLEMMAGNKDWARYGFADVLGLQGQAYGSEYPRI